MDAVSLSGKILMTSSLIHAKSHWGILHSNVQCVLFIYQETVPLQITLQAKNFM
jgi:hypothetical protein